MAVFPFSFTVSFPTYWWLQGNRWLYLPNSTPGPSTPLQPSSKAQAKEDAQELRPARKRCLGVWVFRFCCCCCCCCCCWKEYVSESELCRRQQDFGFSFGSLKGRFLVLQGPSSRCKTLRWLRSGLLGMGCGEHPKWSKRKVMT